MLIVVKASVPKVMSANVYFINLHTRHLTLLETDQSEFSYLIACEDASYLIGRKYNHILSVFPRKEIRSFSYGKSRTYRKGKFLQSNFNN